MWGYIITSGENVPKSRFSWKSADGPQSINVHLETVIDSDSTLFEYHGNLPRGVDRDLLARAFAASKYVSVSAAGYRAQRGLWQALADEECMIEALQIYTACDIDPGDAFGENTSLRLVEIRSSACPELLQHIATNKVIHHLRTFTLEWVPRFIQAEVFDMKSLCSVATGPREQWDHALSGAAWPDMCTTSSNRWSVALRDRNVRPFDHWQRVYAMRECLDDVLPEGVVDDIAADMCSRGVDWWPDRDLFMH